jgi:antitoxin (DNA-binding transcriptional repressor) of toxin-antitoxin stability system
MKRAKISELKNELSRYLRYVRAGESVLVYDRDHPIARLEPVRSAVTGDPSGWIESLERSGVVRAPLAPLPADWLDQRIAVRADVVGSLLEERESGR